jgi:tetratricopeptide (TPR) repeat protein
MGAIRDRGRWRIMTRFRSALLSAAVIMTAIIPAAAEPLDPFAIVDDAMAAYQLRQDYADTRAVLSKGLRDAGEQGALSPGFAVVYAIYSDTARFEGNASFALHLADEGLRLARTQEEVDREFENMLLVSRAYALAELGRYQEAVDSARIPAVWMGERFGADSRSDLESEISNWAARGSSSGASELPDAVQLALDLLQQAEKRANEGDTTAAHGLASRAMLPGSTAIDEMSLGFVNGWSHAVSGYAFRLEGRPDAALRAFKRAAAEIAGGDWIDAGGKGLPEDFVAEPGGRSLAWDIFSNIGAMAVMLNDVELASAALGLAERFASTPERRFTILVQRSAVLLAQNDFVAAEAEMRRSADDAARNGDAANAALAELYIVIIRLHQGEEPDETILAELMTRARNAADLASDNWQQREFILTMAVHQAALQGAAPETLLPLARDAFTQFTQRQKLMRDQSSGQDAARRERRRFLETFIDTNLAMTEGSAASPRPATTGSPGEGDAKTQSTEPHPD